MPRLTKSVPKYRKPKYRKHRPSGQAVVTLSGQDFHLGPHGTKASRIEYGRVVAEWLVGGRRLAMSARNDSGTTIVCLASISLAERSWRNSGSTVRRPARAY